MGRPRLGGSQLCECGGQEDGDSDMRGDIWQSEGPSERAAAGMEGERRGFIDDAIEVEVAIPDALDQQGGGGPGGE